MNKILSLGVAALTMLPAGASASSLSAAQNDTVQFTVVKENPITSIKNQNNSGTCWAYSSLGFLEAELLRMGKGTHDLCESFLVYKTYLDRADKAVRTHGDVSFSQGGSFYDAIYCLKHYGMVPQDAMPAPGSLYGDSLFNFTQLDAVTSAYVGAIAKGKQDKISLTWKKDLDNIYRNYFGELPTEVKVGGKTYTPQTYVTDYLGLNPDDYVSLTSYSHQPFYDKFILEIQDNWRWAESYNLPLDDFMRVMDTAVRNGYSIAWGADVSETYFGRRNGKGYAYVPKDLKVKTLMGSDQARWSGTTVKVSAPVESEDELTITQELRQQAYDNWETTDDHGMVIYGIAKDPKGHEYYMVKNSWGEYGPYKGITYASKAYVAYKTMNIVLNKKALPADIRKKLGL